MRQETFSPEKILSFTLQGLASTAALGAAAAPSLFTHIENGAGTADANRTPNHPWTGLFHTFMLLQSTAGATWRQADYRAWLGEAGFEAIEFAPTTSPSTLVLAR